MPTSYPQFKLESEALILGIGPPIFIRHPTFDNQKTFQNKTDFPSRLGLACLAGHFSGTQIFLKPETSAIEDDSFTNRIINRTNKLTSSFLLDSPFAII